MRGSKSHCSCLSQKSKQNRLNIEERQLEERSKSEASDCLRLKSKQNNVNIDKRQLKEREV